MAEYSRYRKPGSLTRLLNRIAGWGANLGVTPASLVSLEVRGRKTGEIRSTPVTPIEVDGRRYLVAPRGETSWVRNLRAVGQGTLRRGRNKEAFTAEEVAIDERATIIQAYVKKQPAMVQREFHTPADGSTEAFQAIAEHHPVFRISAASRE
jgi:deazaflavin-dependent oxidoreductase (nitroreductase family)